MSLLLVMSMRLGDDDEVQNHLLLLVSVLVALKPFVDSCSFSCLLLVVIGSASLSRCQKYCVLMVVGLTIGAISEASAAAASAAVVSNVFRKSSRVNNRHWFYLLRSRRCARLACSAAFHSVLHCHLVIFPFQLEVQ